MHASANSTSPAPTSPPPPSREPRTDAVRSRARGLRCVACGEPTPLEAITACTHCLGPLAVEYALDDLHGSPAPWSRPSSRTGLARYAELLPPVDDPVRDYPLEGTPLRPAPRLAAALGLAELYLKDDTVLPTGSFKDRPATVAVAQALRWGYPAVGCASTGNLAAATARAATRAGLPSFIFVPRGLPAAKLDPVRQLGGTLVEVDGSYDVANRIGYLAGEQARIGLVNITLRPFYTEGSKIAWHETLTSLEGRPPDHVVIPLGSGALLSATARGIAESRALGWIDGPGPALVGSQPVGCSPIVDAFLRGSDEIIPVEHPDTIAESLAIGDPASGPEVLRAIRASHGTADRPTAEEVRAGIRELARREGLWTEPAGGTVIATLKRLRAAGSLRSGDRVVAYLTGAGWKAPHVLHDETPTAAPIAIDPRRPDLSGLLARIPSARPPTGGAAW